MRRSAALLTLILVTGCSEKPRAIVPARAIPATNAGQTIVEISAMKAPEKSDPAAVEFITAAINAHTNNKPAEVNKLKSIKLVRNGYIRSPQQEALPQHWTINANWPSQYRVQAVLADNMTIIFAWSGSAGWSSARDRAGVQQPTKPMTAAEVENIQLDVTGEWLCMLFPFIEPESIVTTAAPTTINGKPATGIRLFHPKLSPAIAHFDNETKLLQMITYEGRESGQKVVKEFDLLEHKEFDGVKLPFVMAQKANGEQYAEWRIKALESTKQDSKLFDAP